MTAVFFLNGLALVSYVVRLPALKEALGLSNGEMGTVGMLFAVSALVAMQFVGRLAARHGSASVIRVSLLATPLALGCVGLAGNLVTYALATVALGAVHGTIDVAMNARAATVERRLGRPILSSCHAAWSVSAIVASLVGAAVIRLGLSTAAHLLGVAAAMTLAGAVLGRVLARSPAEPEEQKEPGEPAPRRGVWRAGWTRGVVRLGVAGMLLMVLEGAVLDWSGVYLHDDRGASLALASTGVVAFTGCQAAGRVVGDRLRSAYGDAALFRIGGLIGTAGLALAVLSPDPRPAVAGFAVLGLGSSVLIPMAFSAVGRLAEAGGDAAAAMSRFTTFTYAGILLGPALIGWIAQVAGLAWTLAVLVPLLGTVALTVRLPPAETPRPPGPAGRKPAKADPRG
ncbi:MFS transporter [Streptomyces sp. MAR4 CNX-425]|uniref:MFS transporter n=1 Tax=Streptomyces sp. MAR4 CNX-425 TaxID=3406343 RepID=UPI003B50D58C